MNEELKYSEKDLEIAKELSGLTRAIQNLDEKMTAIVTSKKDEHKDIWNKLEKHSDRLDTHNAFVKWIIGVGIGLQAAWAMLLGIFKH